jgi:hypothetical protein
VVARPTVAHTGGYLFIALTVNLSVDATRPTTVYIMHRSQARPGAIHCLYIGSSPDVRAHGDAHGFTALLRSPSDLPEPPLQQPGG